MIEKGKYAIMMLECEGNMKVKIGISARHLHLSDEDLITLFGEGFVLEPKNPLTQTGEFASTSIVDLRGPKGELKGVRVVGPTRSHTQVEISKTDSYVLGVNPPVRDSGDLTGSVGVTVVGPKGIVELQEGCIIASRHIHLNREEALKYGLEHGSVVRVQVGGEKGGILDNVHVKLKDNFVFELHLDLDDANAHLLKNGDEGEIIHE